MPPSADPVVYTRMMRSRQANPRGAVLLAALLSTLLAAPQTSRVDQAASGDLRARAWGALRSRVQEKKYLDHSLAVEAIMRELAVAGEDDREEWGAAGLLHDIDIATTKDDLPRHGLAGAQILRDLGFSQDIVHAVAAHDDRAGVARTSRLDHAVYCADQLYWLVAAAGAAFQSGKLNAADPEALWALVNALPAKRDVAAKVSAECAGIGFSMARALAAVQAASRKLSEEKPAP